MRSRLTKTLSRLLGIGAIAGIPLVSAVTLGAPSYAGESDRLLAVGLGIAAAAIVFNVWLEITIGFARHPAVAGTPDGKIRKAERVPIALFHFVIWATLLLVALAGAIPVAWLIGLSWAARAYGITAGVLVSLVALSILTLCVMATLAHANRTQQLRIAKRIGRLTARRVDGLFGHDDTMAHAA